MPQRVRVAAAAELPPGKCVAINVGANRVAVFNVGGEYFAIDDKCPHRGGPLSEGELDGTTVSCPWHAATFDLRSGAVTGPPANTCVKCYAVKLDAGEVFVETP